MKKVFSKIKNVWSRDFSLLLTAQVLEQLADCVAWMGIVAIVLTKTPGSAFSMSMLMFWLVFPMILFGHLSGVYVDRWNKRWTMILANVIRAGITILLITDAVHEIPIFAIYIFIFIFSFITQFFIPAKSSIIPKIVSTENLIFANSFSTSLTLIMILMGTAIGSIFVAHVGIAQSFMFSIVLFVLSALSIGFIKCQETIKTTDKAEVTTGVLTELIDGIKIILQIPMVNFVVKRILILMAVIGAFYVELIVYCDTLTNGEKLMKNIEALGYLQLAFGVGIMLGPVILGILEKKLSKIDLIEAGFLFVGFATCIFALNESFTYALIMAPFIGIGIAVVMILVETTLQMVVPPNAIGRVFSSMLSIRNTAFILVALVIGIAEGFIKPKFTHPFVITREQIIFFISGLFLVVYGLTAKMAKVYIKKGEQV
ncbi:MAG: MFS transporter [Candidatus Firestonebacteria bacterium]